MRLPVELGEDPNGPGWSSWHDEWFWSTKPRFDSSPGSQAPKVGSAPAWPEHGCLSGRVIRPVCGRTGPSFDLAIQPRTLPDIHA
jgi:hypothetical protein